MIARFCSLLSRWWDSLMGTASTPAAGRSNRRRLCLEQCEQRAMFAATDFVSALYFDILNRAADQGGLDSYNDQLHHGVAPADVAKAIWNSTEHRGIEVDGFYQTLLHRNADPLGRQYYIDQLKKGVSEESVMLTIVTSDEYIAKNSGGEAYVNALYHDILGRDADATGFTDWVARWKPHQGFGTALEFVENDVAWEFIHSDERHTKIVDAHYDKNLLRDPDPDGEAYWVDQLDHGTREDVVALAFVTSQEYLTDYPVKPLFS